MNNTRFFRIGGVTIRVDSDLPMDEKTFDARFEGFRVEGPGEDTIVIHHHFSIPEIPDLGREVYRRPPWVIFRNRRSWVYGGILPGEEGRPFYRVAVFNDDHTRGDLYNGPVLERNFRQGGLKSLTLFPTDQVLLSRVLADREGAIFHGAGLIIDGEGYLFAGHSEAGKSTMTMMLKDRGEILCDDRIIVRRWPDGFHIHGTWSHGDVPQVSSAGAPLKAILFLVQAPENRLVPISSRAEITRRLPALLIKSLVTAGWWHRMFDLVEGLARETACYDLHFDKSGKVVELLP